MSGRLADRVAVVTGGASGLGRAIALRFADEGAYVVVGDLRDEPREGGASTADLLADRGVVVEADAAEWNEIDRLVRTALDHKGRLHGMGCKPGISRRWAKTPPAHTEG